MDAGFPEYLRFYEGPMGDDVLNSITCLSDNKVVIRYTRTYGFTTQPEQKLYECDPSQLSTDQKHLLDHWKNHLKLEPNSNPNRYVNVLLIQKNLDEIQLHRIGNGYSYESIQESSDAFVVTYRIERLYSRSNPNTFYNTTITYPKWMLRQDQIDRLHYILRTS